jgi:hypothetical protein
VVSVTSQRKHGRIVSCLESKAAKDGNRLKVQEIRRPENIGSGQKCEEVPSLCGFAEYEEFSLERCQAAEQQPALAFDQAAHSSTLAEELGPPHFVHRFAGPAE